MRKPARWQPELSAREMGEFVWEGGASQSHGGPRNREGGHWSGEESKEQRNLCSSRLFVIITSKVI